MADITSVKGHMQIVIVYKAPQCKFQELKDVLISKLLPVLNIKHSNILINHGRFQFEHTDKK